MRLLVECQDRMGITMDILSVVVAHRVNLSGIELEPQKLYLHLLGAAGHTVQALQRDIVDIKGVVAVSKVDFMPNEREHYELNILLRSLVFPVISTDNKGRIMMANPPARTLFAFSDSPEGQSINKVCKSLNFTSVVKAVQSNQYGIEIEYKARTYSVDVFPVVIERWKESINMGYVLCFHPLTSGNSHRESRADLIAPALLSAPPMQAIQEQLAAIADLDANVLISGEVGTGKLCAASYTHQSGQRCDGPFIIFSCSAYTDQDAARALLGVEYERDAATPGGFFAQAKGGTLLLDDIDALDANTQTRLGAVLQGQRRVTEGDTSQRVRVMATTRKSLRDLCQKGLFREDLYLELGNTRLHLPPLRQRSKKEISAFIAHCCKSSTDKLKRPPVKIHGAAMRLLQEHDWPGNWRELNNVLLQAVSRLESDLLEKKHLDIQPLENTSRLKALDRKATLEDMIKHYERELLVQLYPAFPSSRKLGKRLGLSHTAVANKLREYGINAHEK